MSHENIRHPDDYQFDRTYLEWAKLKAEVEFYKERYDSACADLRSIHDRVEKGERVYFVCRDGSKLEMARGSATGSNEPDADGTTRRKA